MPLTLRNDKGEKLTFDELDGNFTYLVSQIPTDALSSVLEDGKIYIGNNLNEAEKQTLNKTLVGLPNVDNTSDANKPISTATQTALDLKSNIASPTFTGVPSAPTASGGTNTTQIATTAFVTSAVSAIPTPTLATVTTAGNTTTNDITVGGLVVNHPSGAGAAVSITKGGAGAGLTVNKTSGSGHVASFTGGHTLLQDAEITSATASTPTFFSSAKQLITATGALFGTWLNGLSGKSTPIDADTIVVNDSASSFEAKKTTALQFWTNYIKVKADATYNAVFTISNNVWVDLNNGNDGTGLLQRQDKPYKTVQAGINAIVSLGNVNQSWQVNVLGDYTYTVTEYIYIPTAHKNNVTVIFNGVITTSIANSTAIRPYIGQSGFTLSNWSWIFKDLRQTTNLGLISSNQLGLSVVIEKGTIKNGKGTIGMVEADYGIYMLGSNSSLTLGNVTWDLNIIAGSSIYGIMTQVGAGCVMKVSNLTISGNPQATLASYGYVFSFGSPDYLEINNVNFNSTVNYTNMNLGFTLCSLSSAREVKIGNVNQELSANLPSVFNGFRLLQLQNCKAIYVDNANLINRFCFSEGTSGSNLTIGNVAVTGREGITMTDSNLNIIGVISRTGFDTASPAKYPLITMNGKSTINGGILIDDKRTYIGGSNQGVVIAYDGVNIINSTIIKNNGTSAGSTQANSNIVVWTGNLILNNVTLWTTNGNTNSASNLVWGANNNVLEGNYITNYYGTSAGTLINNADVKFITNLQL